MNLPEVANLKVKFLRDPKILGLSKRYENAREWMNQKGNLYVGRRLRIFITENGEKEVYHFPDSKWANPFVIGKHGTRDEVLLKYRKYLLKKIQEDPKTYNLEELRKKKSLGCWCREEKDSSKIVCHAQILVQLLKEDECDEEPIEFWKEKGPFGYLSNFFETEVLAFGKKGSTNEHLYQAVKYFWKKEKYQEYIDEILMAKTPTGAFCLGRQECKFNYNWAKPLKEKITETNAKIDPKWEDKKVLVMEILVQEKFLQNPNLREKLLQTGNRKLVEKSPYDSFWGTGKNGKGKNMLGKILEKTREKLRQEPTDEFFVTGDGEIFPFDEKIEEFEGNLLFDPREEYFDLRKHNLGFCVLRLKTKEREIFIVLNTEREKKEILDKHKKFLKKTFGEIKPKEKILFSFE